MYFDPCLSDGYVNVYFDPGLSDGYVNVYFDHCLSHNVVYFDPVYRQVWCVLSPVKRAISMSLLILLLSKYLTTHSVECLYLTYCIS